MKINKALKQLMKGRGYTQDQMAVKLGATGGQRVIQRKLSTENWKTDSVLDFLDELGYELVIKPKQRGKRSENEIVIDRNEE